MGFREQAEVTGKTSAGVDDGRHGRKAGERVNRDWNQAGQSAAPLAFRISAIAAQARSAADTGRTVERPAVTRQETETRRSMT